MGTMKFSKKKGQSWTDDFDQNISFLYQPNVLYYKSQDQSGTFCFTKQQKLRLIQILKKKKKKMTTI